MVGVDLNKILLAFSKLKKKKSQDQIIKMVYTTVSLNVQF